MTAKVDLYIVHFEEMACYCGAEKWLLKVNFWVLMNIIIEVGQQRSRWSVSAGALRYKTVSMRLSYRGYNELVSE